MNKTKNNRSISPQASANAVDPFEGLHRLLKLGNRLNAPFSEHLEKRFRVTMNEFRVIMLLGRTGASASHELADISGVSTMSVSRAVTSLERKGWITCNIDENNRRRKILRLTSEGKRLYKQMLPTADKVAQYLFDSLREDEFLAFDHYVVRLIDSLEASDEDGRSIFLEKTRPEA